VKHIVAALGLALIVSGGLAAQGNTEATITALDKGWAKAYVDCDTKAWDALLASDLVFIHNNGGSDNKAAQMKSIAACSLESLANQQTSIRLYGDNTAVLIGAMQGKVKNSTFTFDLIYTRTYIKKNGAWQLVSHQSTDAPKKKT